MRPAPQALPVLLADNPGAPQMHEDIAFLLPTKTREVLALPIQEERQHLDWAVDDPQPQATWMVLVTQEMGGGIPSAFPSLC